MYDQAMALGLMKWRICLCPVSDSYTCPIDVLTFLATDAKSYGGSAPRREYNSSAGMGGGSYGMLMNPSNLVAQLV